MNQKFFLHLALAASVLSPVALSGCDDDDPSVVVAQPVCNLTLPQSIANGALQNEKFTLRNVTTGDSFVFASQDEIAVASGVYDVVFTADYLENDTCSSMSFVRRVSASASGVLLNGEAPELNLNVVFMGDSKGFVFDEIFFTGTLTPEGKNYTGCAFVSIFNNTDSVLYADRLAFSETQFRADQFFKFTPDIRSTDVAITSLYVVPGSGKEHPVLPGERFIICEAGIDHTPINSLGLDLSNADFEIYDESTNPKILDVDGPAVPNLDRWYSSTKTYYVFHNQGLKSFVLSRIPESVSVEQYLQDYVYDYNYDNVTDKGTFAMSGTCYRLPNDWIVDGVNSCVRSSRQWNVLPASVDAGWAYCATVPGDTERFFKSIRRKKADARPDGSVRLQDTNNSSEDFEVGRVSLAPAE